MRFLAGSGSIVSPLQRVIKMQKSTKISAAVGIVVLILGLLWVTSSGSRYPVEVSQSGSFMIDMPFEEVRKIMVRSNACKEIINADPGSKLISQKWDNTNFHLGKIDFLHPHWQVNAEGQLKVEFTDSYIGTAVADLTQTVTIVPDKIESLIKLNSPQGRLLGYSVATEMFSKDGKSEVKQTLQLKIETPAPWFARGYARSRVKASAKRIVKAMEQHILKAVKQHEGEF